MNPEYSLERLMLKLKLQYFGHLLWRVDSLEKNLILEKTEDKRRRGWQSMRWLDTIMDSMDMKVSKLQETVEDRGHWYAAVHGVTKSWTWLNKWRRITTTTKKYLLWGGVSFTPVFELSLLISLLFFIYLDSSTLSRVFCKYFVCDLSSHSLDTVFSKTELSILMKSSLYIISFMNHTFGVISKKISSYPRSSKFSPV